MYWRLTVLHFNIICDQMRAAVSLIINRGYLLRPCLATFAKAKGENNQGQTLENQFTELFTQKKKGEKVTAGRAWRSEELRIKSNEDLHKLWYVCVKEKNLLLADKVLEQKLQGDNNTIEHRLLRVKKTMNRILGVVNERELLKRKYREQLESEYIESKRSELEKAVSEEQQLPEITWEMLRAKYHNLRQGIDNVKYLERIWDKKEENQARKDRMLERMSNFKAGSFNSFWEYEMTIGERPLQEEILRAHIKNWKSLNLKQRKIVLGFLNARRAKDAKSAFLKQLKILGQKIAHDQVKSRITNQE